MDRSPHVAAFPRPARHKFAAHLALANAYLDAFADSLPSRYAGASAFLFDTHSTVGAVLDDPAAFGFRDSTGWCGAYENLVMDPGAYDEDECKWPLSEYVYYDSYHLSWAAQAELGKAVGNVSSAVAFAGCQNSASLETALLTSDRLPLRRHSRPRPRRSGSANAGTRSRPAGSGSTRSRGRCRERGVVSWLRRRRRARGFAPAVYTPPAASRNVAYAHFNKTSPELLDCFMTGWRDGGHAGTTGVRSCTSCQRWRKRRGAAPTK